VQHIRHPVFDAVYVLVIAAWLVGFVDVRILSVESANCPYVYVFFLRLYNAVGNVTCDDCDNKGWC